jgi:ATP-dependent DNA helicase RecG
MSDLQSELFPLERAERGVVGGIQTVNVSDGEINKILKLEEGHFTDVKAIETLPAGLTRAIAALSNAEGGELFIGIDENRATKKRNWRGFANQEAANAHVQVFEQLFPLGADFKYDFLANENRPGLVLKIQIAKTRDIKVASNGKIYVRRGAQNLPVEDPLRIEILRRDKGLVSFETEPVNCDPSVVTNSEHMIKFMLEVVPTAEPAVWLKKQLLLTDNKPSVGAIVLFADEPQAILPKRCGIKVYRYKTTDAEGTRESLDFDPISIEGCTYDQIHVAVRQTAKIIESVRIRSAEGLASVTYPETAIHEIVTNSVLHRDYSIADDVHIKIFDNRVEVLSPGTLPGHVTTENILSERFARNASIVRLINKFPNPPNKDVREGLNTAFQAMREMKLKDPVIKQEGGYVKVILRHESLATPEEIILDYLRTHEEIVNREAREMCFIGSENKMKRILQRMVATELIEPVPGRSLSKAAYRLPKKRRS